MFMHMSTHSCCGNACRHCPYGHISVASERRRNAIQSPVLFNPSVDAGPAKRAHVMLWCGGLASFVALRTLQRQLVVRGMRINDAVRRMPCGMPYVRTVS